MRGCYGVAPSGDKELDARRNERVTWHRVVERMRDLAETPLNRADGARNHYIAAKAAWMRAFLRLDQVRAA